MLGRRWPREPSCAWTPQTPHRPRHPADPAPTLLRARTPADIAAFVPIALGFLPERSVVMVSVGRLEACTPASTCPRTPTTSTTWSRRCSGPPGATASREVVVVVYDDDTTVADEAAWALHEEFTAAGIGVREVLRVHDDHWYAVLPGAPLAAYQGVPFARAEHPFTAQGVFDGRVTHTSREALRATIAPDEGAVAARSSADCSAGAGPAPGRTAGAGPTPRGAGDQVLGGRTLAAVALSLAVGRPSVTRRGCGSTGARRAGRRPVDRRRTTAPGPARRRTCGGPGLRRVAPRRRRPGVVRRRPVPRGRARPLPGRPRRPAAGVGHLAGRVGASCAPGWQRAGIRLTSQTGRATPRDGSRRGPRVARVRTWEKRSTQQEFSRADRTRHREKVRRNLDVFARMLREAAFDTDDPMTGLEMELNLIDDAGDPALKNAEVLEAIADPDFQTELGQFNIEINLAPAKLREGGLGDLRGEPAPLAQRRRGEGRQGGRPPGDDRHPADAGRGAHERASRSAPTRATSCSPSRSSRPAARTSRSASPGASASPRRPTRSSPRPRAPAPSSTCRPRPTSSPPTGTPPRRSPAMQVAVSANSPFLLGKELWRETRIPLFEQATDTRSEELKAQGVRPRVWFGERWITSVFDLFEENVRYFPALLPVTDEEDPLEVLEAGGTPSLHELRLHNGTIYRWNRPVYDIADGVPHLRVENRLLAAGPTVADTIANAALWFGLVRYLAESERPLWSQMSFSAAEENFHVAAQTGVDAQVYWPGVGPGPGHRARAAPAAADGARRPRVVGRAERGARPLPRDHRAAVPGRRRAVPGGSWSGCASAGERTATTPCARRSSTTATGCTATSRSTSGTDGGSDPDR